MQLTINGSVPKGGAGTSLIDKIITCTNDVPDAPRDRAGPRVLKERKGRLHRLERPRYDRPKARRGEATTHKRSARRRRPGYKRQPMFSSPERARYSSLHKALFRPFRASMLMGACYPGRRPSSQPLARPCPGLPHRGPSGRRAIESRQKKSLCWCSASKEQWQVIDNCLSLCRLPRNGLARRQSRLQGANMGRQPFSCLGPWPKNRLYTFVYYATMRPRGTLGRLVL